MRARRIGKVRNVVSPQYAFLVNGTFHSTIYNVTFGESKMGICSFPRVRDDFATDFSRSYRFTYLQALINRPIHKVGCTESEEFWSPTLTFESWSPAR